MTTPREYVQRVEAERDAALAEVTRLREALDRTSLAYIEATNPGIDMDEVKASRAALAEGSDVLPVALSVTDVAAVVRRYRDGWGRSDDDWYLISSSWAREVIREPMTSGERAVSDAVIAVWDGLAEGSDVLP